MRQKINNLSEQLSFLENHAGVKRAYVVRPDDAKYLHPKVRQLIPGIRPDPFTGPFLSNFNMAYNVAKSNLGIGPTPIAGYNVKKNPFVLAGKLMAAINFDDFADKSQETIVRDYIEK